MRGDRRPARGTCHGPPGRTAVLIGFSRAARPKGGPFSIQPPADGVYRGPEDVILDPAAAAWLIDLLKQPTCLVCVGNPLRHDDGIGPWIAGAVREAAAGTKVRVLDAQDVPENFAPVVARDDCRNVVFIDAVAADGPAGTIVFGPLADFKEAPSLSTHKLSLSLSAKFLEAAGKKVFLLGIVPGDLSFGEGFSPEIADVAAALRDLARKTLGSASG